MGIGLTILLIIAAGMLDFSFIYMGLKIQKLEKQMEELKKE